MTAETPFDRDHAHVFLLAGQSNMSGRGKVELEDNVPHPRVWMFDRLTRWVPAIDPTHFDKPVAGVGPGRSFARVLADRDPKAHILLVPTAVGGSAITSWVPGGVYAETGAHPYDEAIARGRAATETARLKAILWHQGESDSTPEAAPAYEERLRDLIRRFRQDLNSPELPFIIGQLGRFASKPWDESTFLVDSVHRRLAREIPHCAFVSAEGLRDKDDGLHFDAAAARELGERYAATYLQMAEIR